MKKMPASLNHYVLQPLPRDNMLSGQTEKLSFLCHYISYIFVILTMKCFFFVIKNALCLISQLSFKQKDQQ